MSRETIIIDTREEHEYEQSHVDGAINIPPRAFMTGEVPSQLADVARDTPLILYCRSGQRSNTCSMFLRQYGFTNITNGRNEHQVGALLERTADNFDA